MLKHDCTFSGKASGVCTELVLHMRWLAAQRSVIFWSRVYCGYTVSFYSRWNRIAFFRNEKTRISPYAVEHVLVKPMAKRTCKSTQVFDLSSTCISFRHPLVSTCVDFGRAQIWTQVFNRLTTQCNVSRHKFIPRRLANPFGHPPQVRTQVLVCKPAVWLASNMEQF